MLEPTGSDQITTSFISHHKHKMAIIHQLVALLLVLCFAAMVGAQDALLDLSSRDQNFITLRCRDRNFVAIDNADFWITDPSMILESILLAAGITFNKPGDGTIQFQLSPSLEGEYFCGVIADSTTSNGLELVVFVEESEVRDYYAVETGQPVSMQCPFRPGNLIQYYTYSWVNGANTLMDPRYTVTTDGNFNITVTEPSDTSPSYRCRVRVFDPLTGSPRPLRISGPIELVVYEQATIVSTPMNRVIATNEASTAEFTCRVKGSPLPDVTWRHNGQDITQLDDSKFQSSTEDVTTDTFTSKLTISQITGEDSSIITCTAENSVDIGEMGGIPMIFSDQSEARLSVLSDDFFFRITVTTEGAVQHRVTLLAAIPEPVGLMIRYFDTETGRSAGSLTGEIFNTAEIFYEDTSPPYQRFRVQVALVVANVIGPFAPRDLGESAIIDLTIPQTTTIIGNNTSNNSDNNTRTIVLAVSIPCGVALLITITILLSVWCIHWDKARRQRNYNEEQSDRAEDLREKARKETNPAVQQNYLESALEAEKQRRVPDFAEVEGENEEDPPNSSGPAQSDGDIQ